VRGSLRHRPIPGIVENPRRDASLWGHHPWGGCAIEGDSEYRLGDEVKDITTPLLITDPEDEQFWPGQSQQLYDLLPGPKDLVHFTAHEGANRRCEPLAPALRDARVFDWLDTYLA